MTAGRLSTTNSVFLDLVRFAAAVVVFWSHITQARFSMGFTTQGTAGHMAVCVFFVLSGFVIRMVTSRRTADWRGYLIERASRIYSVVLPCLSLTLLLESTALLVNADRYHSITNGFDWQQLGNVPAQFFAVMTFSSQLWGYAVTPLSNIPYWSIPFECFYYALYGVALYSVRGKWFWTVLMLLVAGPTIAMFYPIWLLGCVIYDAHQRLQARRHALAWCSLGLLAVVGALMVSRRGLLDFIHVTEVTRRISWSTDFVLGHVPHGDWLLKDGVIPTLERASPSFFLVGIVTAAFLLWSLVFLDRCIPETPARVGKVVRMVADSTFTLYLTHEPLLLLVSTCVGHPFQSRAVTLLVVAGIIIVCIPLSLLFDRFKLQLRSRLTAAMSGKAVDDATRSPAARNSSSA